MAVNFMLDILKYVLLATVVSVIVMLRACTSDGAQLAGRGGDLARVLMIAPGAYSQAPTPDQKQGIGDLSYTTSGEIP